ncbi:hypothetical protein BS50DRAFT_580384 [Corynespora cassiicola Philippines]|uniref:Uncharacterized protein n=1 Tax=Corynespora cassiicola Philippines TaxID=1448308 RepID=A0A2T2N0A3_CORCC|nr:hypothetical protein BS50DRAFT_580384 [Corynespora cassiicola Philippines]
MHLLRLATLAACVAAHTTGIGENAAVPFFSYAQLLELQNEFWQRFTYPNNIQEAQSINSTIFSEDVQGRVSDTRNFVGRELNTEYIFGLFIPSKSVTIIGRPERAEIIQFAANQNIASATTRVDFTFPSFGNVSLPVVIDTWMTWNSAREITQYDVRFRWFGYLLQTLLHSMDPDPATAQSKAARAMANSICNAHTAHCTGPHQQYESPSECLDFLTNVIRVGESFELGMNTLLCRSVHEIMIQYRPDVHCAHVGRDGGQMCDDTISYLQKASETYFTNSPWIPTTGRNETQDRDFS